MLSGDLNGDDEPAFVNRDDNSRHVVRGADCDATAVLDGFMIRGGNADGDEGDERRGGGLFVLDGSPTVRDCIFDDNRAWHEFPYYLVEGGGAYVAGASAPLLDDCTFEANESAGYGGGLSASMFDPAHPVIMNCVFARNVAAYSGGGVFSSAGDIQVVDCLFSENLAGGGSGILAWGPIVISNSTFAHNQGDAAAYFSGTMINSIVYANETEGRPQLVADAASVTYCNIQGGWEGEGNIDADPLFAGGPLGCYYLSHVATGQPFNSPCIDAGSDTAANLGLNVLTTRRDEIGDAGIVDMGYHYPISGQPFLHGDFDRDGDLDADDFAEWASYMTGPCAVEPCWPAAYPDPCGNIADFDDDGDIDLRDFAAFQQAFGQ